MADGRDSKVTATSRQRLWTAGYVIDVRQFGDEDTQDISRPIRNLFLARLISLGAPIAGCTVVEVDEDEDHVESRWTTSHAEARNEGWPAPCSMHRRAHDPL